MLLPFHIILLLLLSFSYIHFQTAWKCFILSPGSIRKSLSISTSGSKCVHPPPQTPLVHYTMYMLLQMNNCVWKNIQTEQNTKPHTCTSAPAWFNGHMKNWNTCNQGSPWEGDRKYVKWKIEDSRVLNICPQKR